MPAGLRDLLVRLFGFQINTSQPSTAPHIILRSSGSWRMSDMSFVESVRHDQLHKLRSLADGEDAGFGYRIGMSKGLKL